MTTSSEEKLLDYTAPMKYFVAQPKTTQCHWDKVKDNVVRFE